MTSQPSPQHTETQRDTLFSRCSIVTGRTHTSPPPPPPPPPPPTPHEHPHTPSHTSPYHHPHPYPHNYTYSSPPPPPQQQHLHHNHHHHRHHHQQQRLLFQQLLTMPAATIVSLVVSISRLPVPLLLLLLLLLLPAFPGPDGGYVRMGLPGTSAQAPSCHETGVTCVPLSGPGTAPPTCYGASLKFSYTALLWANDSGSLADVKSRLHQWEGLSSVPECWAVVQPFLCSVYLPKCDHKTNRVDYPSRELCEKTREPCRVVRQFAEDWPDFLRCKQPYFKPNCGMGAYDQLSSNTTGRCQPPLVRTHKDKSWWTAGGGGGGGGSSRGGKTGVGGLEGCGVQCRSPLYSDAQHELAHTFVAVLGILCLLSSLFTIITFLIDWDNANKYPALILFFINVCYLLATVGWMAQFSSGARDDIVCRVDGTARKTEPQLGSGETAACTVVFVMIYYFTMAALLWFVMLCYAWHVTFRALGTPRDDLSSKTAYFHLVSWSLPLVLTIVCLAISEIDGDYLSGICFVGYHDHSVRAGFVLVPVACVLIVGLFFLCKGLLTLLRIRRDVPEFVGDKAASKIRGTIVRIGVFSALALSFGVMTFAIHIYIFVNETQWTRSLDDYLICLTNRTVQASMGRFSYGRYRHGSPLGSNPCRLEQGPNLPAMLCNIFTFFGTGIIMSSWSWTSASLSAWSRFLKKLFRRSPKREERSEQMQMMIPVGGGGGGGLGGSSKRHNDTFNRHQSFSFHSTHDDPLEMGSLMSRRLSQGSHQHHYADLQSLRGGGAGGPPPPPPLPHHPYPLPHPYPTHHHPHPHHSSQYVYMERDNSSNNGSQFGGVAGGNWRRRRRRRRKRRKKRGSVIRPILGPLLSGVGFRPIKAEAPGAGDGGRRASESSLQSKVSGQGGIGDLLHSSAAPPPLFRRGGSSSSLPGCDPLMGGSVSCTEARSQVGGGGGGRSRRRKLPRLAPLSQHRLRSLSSSRSSLTQFGGFGGGAGSVVGGFGGVGGGGGSSYSGLHAFSHMQQYPHLYPPPPPMYAGYDYARFYANLGYPPQMAYPYWPHYPYPQYPPPPHQQPPTAQPPQPPPPPPPGAASDFSGGAGAGGAGGAGGGGGGSVPRATSTPDMERKRVVTASTSRRSEVTIETQQTETFSLQTVKTSAPPSTAPSPPNPGTSGSGGGNGKASAAGGNSSSSSMKHAAAPPLSDGDDSEEDINSSGLEDSAAEPEEEEEEEEEEAEDDEEEEDEEEGLLNDSDNDTTAGEAEDEV